MSVTGAGLVRAGRVAFGGIGREVCLACVPEAAIGDYVLVHAGIAIARLDEAAAERTLAAIAALVAEQGAPPSEHAPGDA